MVETGSVWHMTTFFLKQYHPYGITNLCLKKMNVGFLIKRKGNNSLICE